MPIEQVSMEWDLVAWLLLPFAFPRELFPARREARQARVL